MKPARSLALPVALALLAGVACPRSTTSPDAGPTDAGSCPDSVQMCSVAEDCPAPSTCMASSCDNGCCAVAPAAPGIGCATDGGTVCDGKGKCIGCLEASDCPASTTICKIPSCASPKCTFTNAPIGTACTDHNGVVCDGNGSCVATHCTDGVLDGDETGVDCGGSCGSCSDGAHCKSNTDCTSSICQYGTCVACLTSADCPATGSECVVPTCSGNECGTMNLGPSHALATQLAGACREDVCDGDGGTMTIDDPNKLPTTTEICEVDPACTGTPLAPTFTAADAGTDCSAEEPDGSLKHLCGDPSGPAAGTCVECNADQDCPGGCAGTVLTTSTCSANMCAGTTVDCASSHEVCNAALGCVACNSSRDCAANMSCMSNVCVANCGNGVIDPGEQCDPGMNPPANDGCGAPGTGNQCQFIPAPAGEDQCPGQAVAVPAGTTILTASSGLSTYGFTDDYRGSCDPASGGPDRVFQLTPIASGTLTVSIGYQTDGVTASCGAAQTGPFCWSSVLYARSTCGTSSTELACTLGVDAVSSDAIPATISFAVTANTPYWVFVDGYDGTSSSDGLFNLIVKLQ